MMQHRTIVQRLSKSLLCQTLIVSTSLVTLSAQPINDQFSNRIAVQENALFTVSTDGATMEPFDPLMSIWPYSITWPPPNTGLTSPPTVWFSWSANLTGFCLITQETGLSPTKWVSPLGHIRLPTLGIYSGETLSTLQLVGRYDAGPHAGMMRVRIFSRILQRQDHSGDSTRLKIRCTISD
jgi:hypothetical protein